MVLEELYENCFTLLARGAKDRSYQLPVYVAFFNEADKDWKATSFPD